MTVFVEISIVIVIAAIISGFIKFLKQPVLIGYIITGLIVGPAVFQIIQNPESLHAFSEFGIALLLFIVGLNLSPKVIREVGKVSVIAGAGQVIFTSVIGYFLCILLGFTAIESAYIAVALTFSSTIIILKLLSDKGDLEKLYGKISVGFLLVQDVIASVILILITALSVESDLATTLTTLVLKGAAVGIILFLLSKYILPKLTKFFASSQEFLFLFSLAWGMGLATLFLMIGFSIEIGALVAGVSLSMLPYNHEISSRMRPLRDFFIIMFFVLLGSQLSLGDMGGMIIPAIIFSLFVIVGNPLIVMFLMGRMGYSKRTGFQSGLTVAQVSEFSLILITLGVRVGDLDNGIQSLVTVVGIITIAVSSYMIVYSEKLYSLIKNYLNIFEVKKPHSEVASIASYDVVLFGYNRIGYNFLEVFNGLNAKHIVVDFNPEVVEKLKNDGIECRYGDAEDGELLDELQLDQIKMAVSTIPDYDTNEYLIRKIRSVNDNAILMVLSQKIDTAYKLYEAGATYVIMPHFLGGEYASNMVAKHKFDTEKFAHEKEAHIKHLEERESVGQDHPKVSKG